MTASVHRGDTGAAAAATVAGGLRDIPDFPTPGVLFKDITPLLADSAAFGTVVSALASCAPSGTDLIAGVEARGFLLAGAVAGKLGCGVLSVRKAGKLPPPTVKRTYQLEYGEATLEVPVGVLDGHRVLLIDDVLATGGTLVAAADLLQQAGADVVSTAVLLELSFLGGRAAYGAELHALLTV
ncbi:MAG: adenine phosphoribosyltransferase [Jatrophihabitans sp.]|uniref:adenine phosphoribosyltransferase n=1 Tax=Jatrophihabitans sp. TaxID=1932789 RepID=UPI003F807593